ncbi:GIY-YIG nuclease family protein [Nisaea sp.]|uniref:GIY-YIG nuclease family protein n=1 Tax=Nisaea sp. TaxID=2024842 RepID=UPI0032F061F7
MANLTLEEFATIVRDLVGMPSMDLAAGRAAGPEPGSYLLLLDIAEPLTIHIKNRDWRLSAGLFVYAGSAHGAGGLKARLRRHFRKKKKPHWHIDRITGEVRAMHALCYQGVSECALCAKLIGSDRFSLPIPRFGSSDCKSCPAHLLELTGA